MIRLIWLSGIVLGFVTAICTLCFFGMVNMNSLAASVTVFGFLGYRFND